MTYLIPDTLSDPFGWLFYRHRAYTTYLMEVPLKIREIEQKQDDTEAFKARTYADVIEFSSWYVAQQRSKPQHLGYVLAHEVSHQMMGHGVVHRRWFEAGMVTGKVNDISPAVTYPYVEWIVQWAFDYQINDGLNRCGFPCPEDALVNPKIGTWFDLEETIYVRLYEEQCKKQSIDPESHRLDPNTGRPADAGSDGAKAPGSKPDGDPTDDRTSGDGEGEGEGEGDGEGEGHPTTGVGRGLVEPKSDKIGGGASDVKPTKEKEERIDIQERRRNAFEKMVAEIDPAKLMGMGAGNMEKLFDRLHPKPMKWFEVVRPKFVSRFGGRVPTWKTFDRSAFAVGYTLQGRVSKTAGILCLVLDTSGSVGKAETGIYISHMIQLAKQTLPRLMVVIEVDWEVQRVTLVRRPHELRRFVEPMLRGEAGLRGNAGTDLRKAHDYLIENDIKPDITLFFTDMGTPFPADKGNSKDVFWIATTDYAKAPVAAGRTLRMTME